MLGNSIDEINKLVNLSSFFFFLCFCLNPFVVRGYAPLVKHVVHLFSPFNPDEMLCLVNVTTF
jgi:hypothetical protein